ncbi:MAG TPA: hypothetical protein DCP92_22835 [Nitrospiraceae bacterium]|nr:hypothetical protein [Nitrospiraceae bacterium]
MFDLGIRELIVSFIVAFVVFGSKRLSEPGRTVGIGLAELKRTPQDVKVQFNLAGQWQAG